MPKKQSVTPPVQLVIERTDPNHLQSIFANDFAISSTGNEVFLTFSQVQPPLGLPAASIKEMKSLEAVAVAKIVVTPALAQAILKVMTENVKPVDQQ